jgi:hypothetical protein
MDNQLSPEDIDHQVQLGLILKKVTEAKKKEKLFGPTSYVYVMIANTDEKYVKNLPKPGHIKHGLDTRYRTHIKIGKSVNPIIRRTELEQNISLKNDHKHPKGVKTLELWFVTEGGTSVEKFIREAIATRWYPLSATGEYLTYTGHWEDWIDCFEQFCEDELGMLNHKIIECMAYHYKNPSGIDLDDILPGLKESALLNPHPEAVKIMNFLGGLDEILVGAYPQQVFSEGRLPGSRRNSPESDPLGISSISVNRSRKHGRSSPVIH